MSGAWSGQSVRLDHTTLDVANSLDRACFEGGLRGRRKAFGLGFSGWPRMDARGLWWSIGTGSSGRLDLFSAIRGAQRLRTVRNLIQTTLGLV
jgi:hypothetical protein